MSEKKRVRSITATGAAVVLLVLCGKPSPAVMIKLTPDQLAQTAPVVVVGRVDRIHSAWNDDRTMIHTYVTLSVDEQVKGTLPESEVVVRTVGGTVGETGCRRSDQPDFVLNETTLLFLEPEPEEKGVFRLAGAFQGKYPVERVRIAQVATPSEDVRARVGELLAGVPRPWEEIEGTELVIPRYSLGGEWWADGDLPIRYYIEENELNDCVFDEYRAIQRAGRAWEQIPGAYFSLCYEGTTTTTTAVEDGENVVCFVTTLSSTYLGYAYWHFNSTTREIYEADFVLNDNKKWYAFSGDTCAADAYDVESVATHEFGHWLSLNHSSVAQATMKTGLGKGKIWQRDPAPDDQAGIRAYYRHQDGVPKPQPGCWPWAPADPLVMTFDPLVLADIDRDGTHEVIVGLGGSSQGVWALNGDGAPDRENGIGTGNIVDSSPALGDLDADNWLEVAIGSTDTKVYVLNHDGTAVAGWPKATGGEVHSSPALGDIDSDGILEIVVGSDDGSVYAWNANGTLVDDGVLPCCDWPIATGDKVRSSPAIGDLDGDGDLDVVVGSDDGNVYAWNHLGDPLAGWPKATGDMVRSSPALGDIDTDGELEVIVGSVDGKVYAWNGDGTAVDRDGMAPWDWPRTTGSTVESSPALADLDGDGNLDVVIGSADGNVYAWDYTGSALAGWPVDAQSPVTTSPLVGDIDGDNALEVIAVAGARIYAWNASGTVVTGWPMNILGFTPSPVLGDIDGNGELELSFGDGGVMGRGVECRDLGSPYNPNLLPWPAFGHDRYHSSQSGYQPPPVPRLPYFNPADPGWTGRDWGTGSSGAPLPGYSGSTYVSPPASLEFIGSAIAGDYAWAQTEDINVDLALPYRVTFYFSTTNFYQTRFFEFGHVRLRLESPGSPLSYDVDGQGLYVPVGPAVASYLPYGSWTLFEIDVVPSTNLYTIVVGGFGVGTASYSSSLVPSPAVYLEDGPDPGSYLEAYFDDFTVEGTIPEVTLPVGGDLDGDGDVDMTDYEAFALCLNGPNNSPAPTCAVDADIDQDGDVDLTDYGVFQAAYSGSATCGDGIIEGGEECDDGGESATCDADCTVAQCGDGTVNVTAGEECDDGGESATCDADCTVAQCGDGTVNVTAGEECDDANTNGGDGCSAACTIELSDCTIDFDGSCPRTVPECGALFSGGGQCVSVGGGCSDTPPRAYQLDPGAPLIITLGGDMNTLSVFFADFFGSVGMMDFYDADGLPVDTPLYTNGDCVSGTPSTQYVAFSRPVRSIQVTALNTYVWIDTFRVNPP